MDSKTGPQLRIKLWRRDMLQGVIELDTRMRVTRANPQVGFMFVVVFLWGGMGCMTVMAIELANRHGFNRLAFAHALQAGLIVGFPPNVLMKKPLRTLLHGVPSGVQWTDLMASEKDKNKAAGVKGALRAGAARRIVVSAPKAFTGTHPDAGTMRLVLHGVELYESGVQDPEAGLGQGKPPRTRVVVSIHADTTFKGARANLWKVLGLEKALKAENAGEKKAKSEAGKSAAAGAGSDSGSGSGSGSGTRSGSSSGEEEGEDGEGQKGGGKGGDEEGGGGQGNAAKSAFIAQWVRTVSGGMSAPEGLEPPPDKAVGGVRKRAKGKAPSPDDLPLPTVEEEEEEDAEAAAAAARLAAKLPSEAFEMAPRRAPAGGDGDAPAQPGDDAGSAAESASEGGSRASGSEATTEAAGKAMEEVGVGWLVPCIFTNALTAWSTKDLGDVGALVRWHP